MIEEYQEDTPIQEKKERRLLVLKTNSQAS